jgi:transcriptional regulator GlxA family with amidase domain
MIERQVFFIVLDRVDILDLAGPVEVFNTAGDFGVKYSLRFCGEKEGVLNSSAGLGLCGFERLKEAKPNSNDLVFVSGPVGRSLNDLAPATLLAWLTRVYKRGTTICSSSTGAFVLAKAGLLAGRHCTTHWSVVDALRAAAPKSIVEGNALFIEDGNVVTGGGATSSIDLALFILETRHGPVLATKVARELVVYLRRNGQHPQKSVYLAYRDHFRAGVHRVQDWIIQNPFRRATIPELAKLAGLSPRHLSRVFRAATGVSIGYYTTMLRLARARTLSSNPELTQDAIASECGYQDSRQLRRIRRDDRFSGYALSRVIPTPRNKRLMRDNNGFTPRRAE